MQGGTVSGLDRYTYSFSPETQLVGLQPGWEQPSPGANVKLLVLSPPSTLCLKHSPFNLPHLWASMSEISPELMWIDLWGPTWNDPWQDVGGDVFSASNGWMRHGNITFPRGCSCIPLILVCISAAPSSCNATDKRFHRSSTETCRRCLKGCALQPELHLPWGSLASAVSPEAETHSACYPQRKSTDHSVDAHWSTRPAASRDSWLSTASDCWGKSLSRAGVSLCVKYKLVIHYLAIASKIRRGTAWLFWTEDGFLGCFSTDVVTNKTIIIRLHQYLL